MTTITRLFDFPHYQLEKYNLDKALVTKYDGEWVATSTKEYIEKANQISRGLLRLGVKPNDKVAIISAESPKQIVWLLPSENWPHPKRGNKKSIIFKLEI